MIETSYDAEADVFYARFKSDETKIEITQEVAPGVMLDLDADGHLVGIEVTSVGQRGGRVLASEPPTA